MAKTLAQQAIRDLNQRAARGEMAADDVAARLATIRVVQAVALYRAALDMAARHGDGR
jgi:hypothetical protein